MQRGVQQSDSLLNGPGMAAFAGVVPACFIKVHPQLLKAERETPLTSAIPMGNPYCSCKLTISHSHWDSWR